MIMKSNNFKWLSLLLMTAIMLPMSSCKKEEPILQDPAISIVGENSTFKKPGEAIEVPLQLQGDGGAKAIVVRQNGGFLAELPVNADATSFTYTGQTVNANAEEGDIITYSFALLNNQDKESTPVEYTVNVAVYDEITVGGTQLYEVTIPETGLVPDGTTVKFAANRNYYISRSIIFEAGSTFSVAEGVNVYINANASSPVEVVINGTVNIVGTAESPVVMTSSNLLQPGNTASAGDWIWFRINGTGNGSNNGRVSYLRIEYGGERAFRLVNVGNGTQIDHVQVYKASGEGIMSTNGNVNLSYVVTTDCEGGSFRLGDAYSGSMQYVLAVSSEYFDELDDFQIREDASPTISNLTVLGPGSDVDNTHGIRMRANSAGKIYNAIVAGFPRRGVRGNDNIVITDLNGPSVFAYSYVIDVPTDPYRDLAVPFAGIFDDVSGARLLNPFFNNASARVAGEFTLDTIDGIGGSSFIPAARKDSAFNPTSLGSFFQNGNFVGAISDASNDWTRGWVKNPDGSIR